MSYKTDLEIAQETCLTPIAEIARELGIAEQDVEQYGPYKAKISLGLLNDESRTDGRLILVTAMTPTPAGEGKTIHHRGAGRRPQAHWQASSGGASRTFLGPGVRH